LIRARAKGAKHAKDKLCELGAVEAARTLRAKGFQPERSLDIILFTAEEPTRFGPGWLGSRLLGGALEPAAAAALENADKNTLEILRTQAGF